MICEPCNECTCAKCLPTCTQSLTLGTIALALTPVYVYFLNTNTNRADRFSVTTEVDGTVKVDLSTFNLMADANYEIWVTAMSASSIHDMETITIGLDTAECLVTSFVDIDDSSDPENQVSYTTQTIELCEPTENGVTMACILETTFTISAAELATLGTVFVEKIAAPGAKKALKMFGATATIDNITVPYDFNVGFGTLDFFFTGSAAPQMSFSNTFLDSAARDTAVASPNTSGDLGAENVGISVGNQGTTDPSQGDGDIEVTLYYIVTDLP